VARSESVDLGTPPADQSETRALLRWTIGAVCASWVLNLLTFWVALQQHQDARELLDVQVASSKELLRVQVDNAKALLEVQTNLASDQLHVQTGIDLDNEFNSSEMQLRRSRFASGLFRLMGIRDARKVHSIYDLKSDTNINYYLNNFQVFDFFNKVGLYTRDKRLDEETAYVEFYRQVTSYWPLCKEIVAKERAEAHNNGLYSGFEDLYQLLLQQEAKHHDGRAPAPPTAAQLSGFLEEEVRLEVKGQAEEDEEQRERQQQQFLQRSR
jgi:hypothetical protein